MAELTSPCGQQEEEIKYCPTEYIMKDFWDPENLDEIVENNWREYIWKEESIRIRFN